MRKMKKGALLAALMGTTLFVGCLGSYFSYALKNLPGAAIAQFLIDNNAVFDLFPDGGTTTP